MKIELLEPRIAPAAVLRFIEGDGDLIKISTSKGTDALLDAAVTRVALGGGRFQLGEINLSSSIEFNGTTLTVTATRGPDGGDGLTMVPSVDASSTGGGQDLDLGAVSIDGELRDIDAGKGALTSKIASITAVSTSGAATWTLNGSVDFIKILTDLRGVKVNVIGTFVKSVTVGGSLIGEMAPGTGTITGKKFGSVKIGHDIQGGAGMSSGTIIVNEIGSLKVGGSLVGKGVSSAGVEAYKIGPVTIGGDVIGGANGSGRLLAPTFGKITIGGSLRGGAEGESGIIGKSSIPVEDGGAIVIKGSIIGGAGDGSGRIFAENVASILIKGSILGSVGSVSGSIYSENLKGGLTVVGDIQGDIGGGSGGVVMYDQAMGAVVGAVKIGGSLVGGVGIASGEISLDATAVPSFVIGGSVTATTASAGGILTFASVLKSLMIGGSVIGDAATDLFVGYVASIKIQGDLRDATLAGYGTSVPMFIGGSVVGSVSETKIIVNGGLGNMVIGGNIVGTSTLPVTIMAIGSSIAGGVPYPTAIKNLTIGGRVEFARVLAGYRGLVEAFNPDAQIGDVKVGGDWIASTLIAGVDAGADHLLATQDDTAIPQTGEPDAIFSKIRSITIGGMVRGTALVANDNFGFVAQEIGSFTIAGTKIPLTKGHGNDNVGTTLLPFELGTNGDITIREVA